MRRRNGEEENYAFIKMYISIYVSLTMLQITRSATAAVRTFHKIPFFDRMIDRKRGKEVTSATRLAEIKKAAITAPVGRKVTCEPKLARTIKSGMLARTKVGRKKYSQKCRPNPLRPDQKSCAAAYIEPPSFSD
jgi:hypothetical protein